jgi:hypothetical protein
VSGVRARVEAHDNPITSHDVSKGDLDEKDKDRAIQDMVRRSKEARYARRYFKGH